MIILLSAEKASDKTEYPFMTEVIENLRIQGTYLNIKKEIYHKPTAKSY